MGVNPATEIDAWLRQGGIAVTANERAARSLTAAYARARRAESLKAWTAPQILSWQSFVRSTWDAYSSDERLVLSPLQELAVWQDVLAASGQTAATLKESRRRLASQAMTAHGLLTSYAPYFLNRQRHSGWQQDAGVFSSWLDDFEEACREERLLSQYRVPLELQEHLHGKQNDRPPLLLVGFDRLLPTQQEFFNAWGAWHHPDLPPHTAQTTFYRAADLKAELTACALWADQLLHSVPDSRLLVITQNAAELRGQIERAFLTHCAAHAAPAFEFSLGVPLAGISVARSASLLLDWLTTGVAEYELDWLFSTDFLASSTAERYALQAAMRTLRRRGKERTHWMLEAFLCEGARDAALTDWCDRMLAAQSHLIAKNDSQSPLIHAETAMFLLRSTGWPGSRELTSPEYQAMQRFEQAVEACGSLGFNGQQISWVNFLTELRALLAETLFSAETQDAPILIAGPAESAGLTADAIWFLGADENRWPATGDIHPMIPASIQLQYQMPHASAELDSDLANNITDRLLASAPEVRFSFAAQLDGIEQKPSRIITQIAGAPTAIAIEQKSQPSQPALTIAFEDRSLIRLQPASLEKGFHVDSSALTAQSQCPFKGFAIARLAAKGWEPAAMGLSPAARGQLLHSVLHSVWSGSPAGIKTLEQLQAIPSLRDFVSEHASVAMQRIPSGVRDQMPARYLELEEERLIQLICAWLEYEKLRAPFEVQCTESSATPHIGILPLKLRLDRIDRLNDDSLLVIDYKTGDVTAKSWALPRPDDVQLPLYGGFGLDREEEPGGLAFAKVRAGDVCFAGHVGNPQQTLGEVPNLNTLKRSPLTVEMLLDWRDAIEELARDFVTGKADVDPRELVNTCKRCGLQTLCRIQERPIHLEEGDTDVE